VLLTLANAGSAELGSNNPASLVIVNDEHLVYLSFLTRE
jgi:hypothetical protein